MHIWTDKRDGRNSYLDVYKVKFAILGLNVNNFATSKDILMKLHIQRALYYGSE